MTPRPLLRAFLALAALLAAAPARAVEPPASAVQREVTSPEAQRLGKHLAGPEFLGRGTAQEGNEKAALWLAAELAEAGFEPAYPAEKDAPGGGYLQWFELPPRAGGPPTPERSANVIGLLPGRDRAGTVTPAGGAATEPAPGAPAGPAPSAPAAGGASTTTTGASWVVLGAHFDHLGVKPTALAGPGKDGKPAKSKVGEDDVFWGADDNASGTTAVLLAARALGRAAKTGTLPRRGVVIAFFTAEESGLLGSRAYCDRPPVPLADTAAMINLDMVGRNDLRKFEVYGNTSSPELDALNRTSAKVLGLQCSYPGGEIFTRSDHFNFYKARIPVLMLHGGLHNDYHTVRDTPDQVNWAKVALASRHTFEVVWRVAEAEKPPTFVEMEITAVGGRLGVAAETASDDEIARAALKEGVPVRVAAVFTGGLAEKLLQPGDLLLSWNGFPFGGDDPVARWRSFVVAARDGDKVVIRYLRGKERRAASVQF